MSEFKRITYEKIDGGIQIGFGKYETKSMTTLSEDTLKELEGAIQDVQKEKNLKYLAFFSHKPGVYLAGVDIELISSLQDDVQARQGAERGQQLFNMVEDLKCPTLALIDGICLGGGLELSLACDMICVSDNPKTKLGLPEVMLGVLPGFGGTYRLPKKIGLPKALDMILSGRQVNAKRAKKLGLADFVVPAERLRTRIDYFLKKGQSSKKASLSERLTDFAGENFLGRRLIFQKARETIFEKTKGFYPAPLRIIEVLEKGAGTRRERHLSLEAQAFGDLFQTDQCQSLLKVFFLTDKSKKLPENVEFKSINRGAVLGAGTMGGGIAWLFAENGQAPLMKDINVKALELGLEQAAKVFKKKVKRRRMSKDEFQRAMRSIRPTLTFDGFQQAELVIEAIVENMEIKKKVLSDLEKHVDSEALLTSNTSSLSIEEMASALEKPERFAGLHFFNPVNKMPLVEIIRHSKVSDQTIDSLVKWCVGAKKTPVVVNNGPGFLVNRILAPYLNEAGFLLEEGYSVEQIDQAALEFGMPMGPCRLMDEVGLDVSDKVGKIMEAGLGDRMSPSSIGEKLLAEDFLGKKNGKGYYIYSTEDGKTKEEVNPRVAKILEKNGVSLKDDADLSKLEKRLVYPMINEAIYCLSDNIVEDPDKVDIALIYGIGFPPFRGGLFSYVDKMGIDSVLAGMKDLAKQVSEVRFSPAPKLVEMADSKTKFADLKK